MEAREMATSEANSASLATPLRACVRNGAKADGFRLLRNDGGWAPFTSGATRGGMNRKVGNGSKIPGGGCALKSVIPVSRTGWGFRIPCVRSSLKPSKSCLHTYAEGPSPSVVLKHWKAVKDAIQNYTYQNLNPALLPSEHPLRRDIFEKISSTSGIFCALEPQVFVSRIRARIFRNWKAAEYYYTNTLRELKRVLKDAAPAEHEDEDETDNEKRTVATK